MKLYGDVVVAILGCGGHGRTNTSPWWRYSLLVLMCKTVVGLQKPATPYERKIKKTSL
jgi:hypothetical protein